MPLATAEMATSEIGVAGMTAVPQLRPDNIVPDPCGSLPVGVSATSLEGRLEMWCDVLFQAAQIFRDCRLAGTGWKRQVKFLRSYLLSVSEYGERTVGVVRPQDMNFSMAVPFGTTGDSSARRQLRLACIFHIFHPEILRDFVDVLNRLPEDTDIFVSTDTEEKKALIMMLFGSDSSGHLDVRVVLNRGRDIAPKLVTFRDEYKHYDLLLFLHSKRSTHWADGEGWRRHLFHSLAGSSEIVTSIVDAFSTTTDLGMIIPQHWPQVVPWVDWQGEYDLARKIASRIGIRLSRSHVVEHPSGSMFWARPAALAPLLSLGLEADSFPEEAGQLAGTIAHAIERLFLYSCNAAGLWWAKVADPETISHPRTAVQIAQPGEVKSFRDKHGFRLLVRSHSRRRAERQ